MGRFVYMKNKILKASQWLRDRTLIDKAIIHIGLFPLPNTLSFAYLSHG